MKYLFLATFILTGQLLYAQLNNSAFNQQTAVVEADSGWLSLGFNTLGFTKNNEYFNRIADGYTLFGYQVNPYLSYQPLPNVRIDVGVYLQKDFGINGYESIQPTYSFRYKNHGATVIFGTLDGSVSHRLIEPLYDFEKVLIDRLENGFQVVMEKDWIFFDVWADWQNMIYPGDDEQEEVTAGLSLDYKLINKVNFIMSIPIQGVVFHRGGQIDLNDNPLETRWNNALGVDLTFPRDGTFKKFNFSGYYTFYKNVTGNSVFEDGSGVYLNAAIETNFNVEVMASYWKGNEFQSIQGGLLYPSVSSTVKNPFYVEPERELLILRFFHRIKLADNLTISTRFEPFYDLGNSKFEFSHGFYVNYTTDFKLKSIGR